jgi:hypothetical protein
VGILIAEHAENALLPHRARTYHPPRRVYIRCSFSPLERLESRVLFAAPALSGVTLINADTDQPIAAFANLTSGAVLDLSKLPTKQPQHPRQRRRRARASGA